MHAIVLLVELAVYSVITTALIKFLKKKLQSKQNAAKTSAA